MLRAVNRPRVIVAAAAIFLFLLLGFGLFSSTGHDDSHITYWVAFALQKFGRLCNYNGERVEQSSSLAHVVLLAILGMVTPISLPTLGPITSILGGVASILLGGKLARRIAPGAVPGVELVIATAATFVYWSFGGLETTLFAAASLWLILACDAYLTAPGARLFQPAAAIAVFLTARPEAPIVLACTFAAMLVHGALARRAGDAGMIRRALALAVLAAGTAALLFAFRRFYFGSFFPNPVYTKATTIEIRGGLSYLWAYTSWTGIWIAAAALAAVGMILRDLARGPARPGAALTAAFFGAYAGFVVLTGGDWMSGGRFIAHFIPVVSVLAVDGISRLAPRPRIAAAIVGAGVIMNTWGAVALADKASTGRPLWTTGGLRAELDARVGPRGFGWFEIANRVHLRDTTVAANLVDVIGKVRAAHPDRRLLMMSSQAGMVAYHAFVAHHDALRFIDMCSLVTRDIRACLPASQLDRRQVGLQLRFDRYFGAQAAIDERCGTRRPDIVFGLGHRGIEPVLEKNGYTIVFRQRGMIQSEGIGAAWLRSPVSSDEFIAVDTALLAGSGVEVRPVYRWDIR